jgi:putative transposon-encoded protein
MENMENINEQIKQSAKLMQETNKVLEKLGIIKIMENRETVLFDKDIRKFGTCGAHVILPGKYAGHKGAVIVLKKNKKKEAS